MRSTALLTLLAACAQVDTPPEPLADEPAGTPHFDESPSGRMMADLAALRFEALGNDVLRWDHIPTVTAPADDPQRLVVLLVEFADTRFDRFAGTEDQAGQLVAHYQAELFDEAYQKKNTLSHYYATQSDGQYHVTGQVLAPVQLDKPLRAYGSPLRPEGGSWRNDTAIEDLIEEALGKARDANPDLDWSQFDRFDPLDADDDGTHGESDGYVDHLVLIYAGKGQHACQSLYKLNEKLDANSGPEVLETLSEAERACGDRIWPHRSKVKRRESQGPQVGDGINADGGIPLTDSLWVADYNMQCEYTGADTFIHEFGHSIGLPDVYARSASNSTGPWEVMSSTASPAQALSSWSRTQLGWLTPQVVVPPRFGGDQVLTVHLGAIEDAPADGVQRGVLVALPPKERHIALTALPEGSKTALYSGQGNDLGNTAALSLDLTQASEARLSFDAWHQIEAGWDFAYLEASTDGGASWERLTPEDGRHMPAEHGHDGTNTKPGFTGLSGDLDGDGKNESNPACDPTAEVATGEDRAAAADNPCEDATWVRPSFDLAPFVGEKVTVRWRYYTDGAAVEAGLLLDNLELRQGEDVMTLDLEGEPGPLWTLDGFTPSPGQHDLLVPHYYMLEYRDPGIEGDAHYDHTLARGGWSTFWDADNDQLGVVHSRARPGVVAWYVDGAFSWSENDPASNGPGKGYFLVVDSWPEEVSLPPVASLLQGEPGSFTTHYDVSGGQPALEESYYATLCATRPTAYLPPDVEREKLDQHCGGLPERAAIETVRIGGKPAMYSYAVGDLLPGEAQDAFTKVGELADLKVRKGETTYRLRDRALRYAHTLDSPFHWEDFAGGTTYYTVQDGALVEASSVPHPAVPRFSDAETARWQNPSLPFGGVTVPPEGFSFEVGPPAADAPEGTRATVVLRWDQKE